MSLLDTSQGCVKSSMGVGMPVGVSEMDSGKTDGVAGTEAAAAAGPADAQSDPTQAGLDSAQTAGQTRGPSKGKKGVAKSKGRAAPSRLEDARTRMYQDLIFESAECVFGQKGFENATMQDIAAEAGVSLKTVYASFAGKKELYDAIMLRRGPS